MVLIRFNFKTIQSVQKACLYKKANFRTLIYACTDGRSSTQNRRTIKRSYRCDGRLMVHTVCHCDSRRLPGNPVSGGKQRLLREGF